jgi:primosomal protein N'
VICWICTGLGLASPELRAMPHQALSSLSERKADSVSQGESDLQTTNPEHLEIFVCENDADHLHSFFFLFADDF